MLSDRTVRHRGDLPGSASTSGRSPNASTGTCSPTTPNSWTGRSTAATRPLRTAAGTGRIGRRVRQHVDPEAGTRAGEPAGRIAHKHASLGIRPDQYQVVYDNLMWAIGDVLGDAVTPQVADAWDEVYWLMANALINQERGLYSARGVRAETVFGHGRSKRRSARPPT